MTTGRAAPSPSTLRSMTSLAVAARSVCSSSSVLIWTETRVEAVAVDVGGQDAGATQLRDLLADYLTRLYR